MPNYSIGYSTNPLVTIPGGGAVAPDKAVLFWDSALMTIRGDAGLLFDATANTLTLGSGHQLLLPAGTETAPSLSFSADTDKGLWSDGSDLYYVNSTARIALTQNNFRMISSYLLGWSAGSPTGVLDTALSRASAGVLSLSTGSAMLFPTGSAAAPSIAFTGDSTTGIHKEGTAAYVDITTAGTDMARFSIAGVDLLTDAASRIRFGTDSDVVLIRDAANTLALRNGVNAQIFHMYETFTDGSNFSRVGFSAGSTMQLVTNAAGTGTHRPLAIGCAGDAAVRITQNGSNRWRWAASTYDFGPVTDAVYDIGTAALRVRSGYFGGAAASIPLTIKLHASQTANALEVQNSSGTAIASVNPNGGMTSVSAAYPAAPVKWMSCVGGVPSADGTYTSTAASGWGNSGAFSNSQGIPAGYSGSLIWRPTNTTDHVMCGLSDTNPDANYASIDYAIYADAGYARVYESGQPKAGGSNEFPYVAGDELKLSVSAGVVTYYKNGTSIYVSAATPTFPLYPDCALFTGGGVVSKAMIVCGNRNAQEWQNSSNTALAYVDSAFGVYGHGDISDLKFAPANAGGRSIAQNVTNIIGSLAVTGGLQADTIYCRRIKNIEGPPFAGIHGTAIAWTQATATQNQWYDISSASIVSGLINPRITHSAGTLTVENDGRSSGVYQFGYAINVQCTGAGKHVYVGIDLNGTVQAAGQNYIELPSANVERPISSMAILDVPAGATVKLAVKTSDTGTPDITVQQYELTMVKIAG